MNLFITKEFVAHSGQKEKFKIECDALTNEDIETLAMLIDDKFGSIGIKFSSVHGIPNGGIRIAKAFEKYLDKDASFTLILDDVLTTGNSMENYKSHIENKLENSILGCVLFDRSKGKGNEWIYNVFKM